MAAKKFAQKALSEHLTENKTFNILDENIIFTNNMCTAAVSSSRALFWFVRHSSLQPKKLKTNILMN